MDTDKKLMDTRHVLIRTFDTKVSMRIPSKYVTNTLHLDNIKRELTSLLLCTSFNANRQFRYFEHWIMCVYIWFLLPMENLAYCNGKELMIWIRVLKTKLDYSSIYQNMRKNMRKNMLINNHIHQTLKNILSPIASRNDFFFLCLLNLIIIICNNTM